ncbi:apses-domain-containing protein [Lanmaoa asiatica]|nr:apses-domain-containing protein [Lanmaoa asiatica]
MLPVQLPPVKIYNAVYSSVQVYECMVRGIAVMRRRGDSYVNATQILKVAGIEKGRRTKILDKEILPGKHEIVQGGYGKYQGTWIPLDRGRDIAAQYGVAPLLAPLFDFTPSSTSLTSLPAANTAPPSSPSASMMPGSALRLLNQGRAQGLFTPSTSALAPSRSAIFPSSAYHSANSPTAPSPTPPPIQQSLKRARSDSEVVSAIQSLSHLHHASQPLLDAPPDIRPSPIQDDGPSPTKRPRKEPTPQPDPSQSSAPSQRAASVNDAPSPRPPRSPHLPSMNGNSINGIDIDPLPLRLSTKPPLLRDPSIFRDARRAQLVAAICRQDDPSPVFDLLRELTSDPSLPLDVNAILDDKGHSALHLAASLGRQNIVGQLIAAGADIHRGNFAGETPLIRASIDTHNSDQQTFNVIVQALHLSIRTLDTSRKSVLHHIMYHAGIQGRAVCARYYLDQIFMWIAQNQGGDFRSMVDLQDEHGDTALNIAARVGNRSLVRTLMDVGANRILPNKLGLRPGDFGVEVEELSGGPRAEDLLASLRTGPLAPVQKSQDIITGTFLFSAIVVSGAHPLADMTTMIQNLSGEFSAEVKTKQDSLDVTQAHLRAATRELSEQRKQIQLWQNRCAELDQVHQRIRNLEKAIAEEDSFDWTGRTDLSGRDGRETAGPAFQWRGPSSTMAGVAGSMDVSFSVETEPPIPTTDSVASLIRLRRLNMWHLRMEELMEARLKSLQGASAEKEYQCKRIVALCTGIPVDKVEDMLENLVIAMESEAQVVDIVRVSGFMQKVRPGLFFYYDPSPLEFSFHG